MNEDLLVKYLLGEASEEERRLVEAWINSDIANKKQYEDFKTIWEESRILAAASAVDENAAWQRFRSRVHAKNNPAVVRKIRPIAWWRVAALFILIAGAAYLGVKLFYDQPIPEQTIASHQTTLTDTLPDGSVVTLNKNSSLHYPSKFKSKSRTVALEGEAFFTVTPNKEKPFVVEVNDVTIKVVGTSFNVKSINGVTEVIVETGVVEVSRNNQTVKLVPEERLKISPQDSSFTPEKVQDKLYNYYRSKDFVCDNTPLWKFVEVLNEAYEANIVIENPKIRSLLLNVPFYNQPLDRILEITSETLGITVTKEKDRIVLR